MVWHALDGLIVGLVCRGVGAGVSVTPPPGGLVLRSHREGAQSVDPAPVVPSPSAWVRWLPALYIAAILVLEPITPVDWPVSFLLIALPVIAAFAYGPVGTAGVAIFAVGFEALLAGTPCCAG